jgi:DNA-binding protein Fis
MEESTKEWRTKNAELDSIVRSLRLLRSLHVSTILTGEPCSGKKTLLRRLFPDWKVVDGRDSDSLPEALSRHSELIIESFEHIEKPELLDFRNKRVIAVSDSLQTGDAIDEKFAFIYRMPPLRERPEDLEHLCRFFISEAQERLMVSSPVVPDMEAIDLSENFCSLRASVYRQTLLQSMHRDEIEGILLNYFRSRLEGNNAYRESLGILERPLLRAGLERYGSQLKLSEILGINRNTLRKKLREYRID